MKPRTRFFRMMRSLPEEAKKGLVYHYWDNPITLNICEEEVRNNTKRGKEILKDLGYEQ